MKKNKILIFEDEWKTIKGSFELANIYAFNNELVFINKNKSQDVSYNSWKDLYDAVFIDITLAKNTEWDGFNILKEIYSKKLFPLNKIIILTGNSKVKDKLNEMSINSELIKILYKPISFEILANELKQILSMLLKLM